MRPLLSPQPERRVRRGVSEVRGVTLTVRSLCELSMAVKNTCVELGSLLRFGVGYPSSHLP
jgi:hypothetical protein